MTHIGITCSYTAAPDTEHGRTRLAAYIDTLADAGGAGKPLFLPDEADRAQRAEQLAAQLDGLILSGGADLPPALYGEAARDDAHLEVVTPARPAFETELVHRFVERGKPILGICYGCQFLNVWRGGTLIQDIPTQWPDPIRHDNNVLHMVRLDGDTRLHRIVGMDEIEVCSYHHQAIARVAQGGNVTAWAPDHSPEAIEFKDASFLIGVQWHPERTRDSEATHRLMEAFIKGGAL